MSHHDFESFLKSHSVSMIRLEMWANIYALGYMWDGNNEKFSFFNDNICSLPLSLLDAISWLRNFERNFSDEIWFQHGLYKRNKAALEKRVKGGTGE